MTTCKQTITIVQRLMRMDCIKPSYSLLFCMLVITLISEEVAEFHSGVTPTILMLLRWKGIQVTEKNEDSSGDLQCKWIGNGL